MAEWAGLPVQGASLGRFRRAWTALTNLSILAVGKRCIRSSRLLRVRLLSEVTAANSYLRDIILIITLLVLVGPLLNI